MDRLFLEERAMDFYKELSKMLPDDMGKTITFDLKQSEKLKWPDAKYEGRFRDFKLNKAFDKLIGHLLQQVSKIIIELNRENRISNMIEYQKLISSMENSLNAHEKHVIGTLLMSRTILNRLKTL
ncbi:MAG: hypothetical protein JXQ87_15680 [Bacteroidia bacterium]